MKKLQGLGVAAFSLVAACIVACGEDSGTKTDEAEQVTSVTSEDDLPSCGKKNEDTRALVGREIFVCSDRQWESLGTTYGTEEDLPNCTSKREGSAAFITETGEFLTCSNGEWVAPEDVSGDDKPSEGEDEGDDPATVKSSSSVFCWDDDCSGLNASSSSKKEASSSSVAMESSSSVKEKQVEFEEGVLWKPSYGKRVHVFDDGLDEYNFLDDTTRVGWWRVSTDKDYEDNGASTASITYGNNYMTIKHNLVYDNWVKKDGKIVASPEPYAMASFYLGKSGSTDLSGKTGICLVYTADKEYRLDLQSKGDPYDYWDVPIFASSTKRTANIKFKNLPATWWQENSTTISKALKQTYSLSIESPYYNKVHCYESKVSNCDRQTYANTIKLYMIGEYGSCPDYDTYEAGNKMVTFVDDILWQPSYDLEDGTAPKVRTYFGDVDEYNFFNDDQSGWWFTYDDKDNKGTSQASISHKEDHLQATLKLVFNWAENEKGQIAPSPYPYAAFGFDWSSNGSKGHADLTQLGTGICLEYSSTYDFDVKLSMNINGDGRWVHTLPASSSKKVVNLKFNDTDFTQYDWQEEKGSTEFTDDIKKVEGLHFEFFSGQAEPNIEGCNEADVSDCNTEIITNTVKLYKLGKYGACD